MQWLVDQSKLALSVVMVHVGYVLLIVHEAYLLIGGKVLISPIRIKRGTPKVAMCVNHVCGRWHGISRRDFRPLCLEKRV